MEINIRTFLICSHFLYDLIQKLLLMDYFIQRIYSPVRIRKCKCRFGCWKRLCVPVTCFNIASCPKNLSRHGLSPLIPAPRFDLVRSLPEKRGRVLQFMHVQKACQNLTAEVSQAAPAFSQVLSPDPGIQATYMHIHKPNKCFLTRDYEGLCLSAISVQSLTT